MSGIDVRTDAGKRVAIGTVELQGVIREQRPLVRDVSTSTFGRPMTTDTGP